MRERGWEPEEWLERMRPIHEGPQGRGWRQEVEGTASGSWFSTMTLMVRPDAPAYVTFQPVALGGGVTYSTREGDNHGPTGRLAHLRLPRAIPETILATLPGRRVRDVADLDAFGDAVVAQAYRITLGSATAIEFEPACEEIPLPWRLMP